MAKKKYPKAVYRGVGQRFVLDWLFPRNKSVWLGPQDQERKPKIYLQGRHALFDGGMGLLSVNPKRKKEPIPDDFCTPTPPFDFPPLDEWGMEEWRDYALLQQDLAEALQEKLSTVWGDLLEAQNNLSRRKHPVENKGLAKTHTGGLLSIGDWQPTRRGRPRAATESNGEAVGRKVIEQLEAMQKKSGKKVSVNAAIGEYKRKLGWKGRMSIDVSDGTIRNAVSRLKKSR